MRLIGRVTPPSEEVFTTPDYAEPRAKCVRTRALGVEIVEQRAVGIAPHGDESRAPLNTLRPHRLPPVGHKSEAVSGGASHARALDMLIPIQHADETRAADVGRIGHSAGHGACSTSNASTTTSWPG